MNATPDSRTPLPRRWIAGWAGLVLAAAVIAAARGHLAAGAVYGGLAIASAAAATVLIPRTALWQRSGVAGQWRIGLSWGAVAGAHLAAACVFYGSELIGATIVLATMLPPFLTAGTALTTARQVGRIADALEPGENLLAFCSGGYGEPPKWSLLAATDRRVVAFVQPGLRGSRLEVRDSVERPDIVDVDLRQDGELLALAVRAGDHELAIVGAAPGLAEDFVQQLA